MVRIMGMDGVIMKAFLAILVIILVMCLIIGHILLVILLVIESDEVGTYICLIAVLLTDRYALPVLRDRFIPS